jgi:3-hydroxyacyl-[acyl-carrier-protein] dehydratase
MELDKSQILEYQQNRDPYLMIDYVTDFKPGEYSKGFKKLNENDWFFKVHWPGDPNMPGMLQVEAMVQMSSIAILTLPGNKGKILYLTSVDKIKLKKKIIPNDKLILETEIIRFSRGLAKCTGKGYVDSKIACEAEFNLILVDELKKYKIKT